MKINKMVLANAFAATTLFVWVVCTLGVAFFPGPSLMMGRWWMHGLSMTTLGTWRVTLDGFILGGMVLVGFAWITGYVFGWCLDIFGNKNNGK